MVRQGTARPTVWKGIRLPADLVDSVEAEKVRDGRETLSAMIRQLLREAIGARITRRSRGARRGAA